MDLIIVFSIFASIVVLGLAAQIWGVDTRQLDIDPRGTQSSTGLF